MNYFRLLVVVLLLLSGVAGCDMSTSHLGQAEHSVRPAMERAASLEAAAKPAAPGKTRAIGVPADAPKVDAAGIMEATFDDVKFEMDKAEKFERTMLTPKVKSLFDQRIRIRGYMYPTLRRKGLTQFVLVRDNMECCFGPGAALYDCVLVTMQPGRTAEYSIRPIAVEGTFRLEELPGPDGRPLAIYQMAGEAVD